MFNPSAALVIGGTGYIGKSLVKQLQKNGHKVYSTSRETSTNLDQFNSNEILNWNEFVNDLGINKIFITAGLYQSIDNSKNWNQLWEANYSFPKRIVDEISSSSIRVVILGSYLQKDPESRGMWSFYTWSKVRFRDYLINCARTSISSFRYVYLYDTYGNDDRRSKIYNILMEYKENKGILDCGSMNQVINLTHIDDITQGLIETINVETSDKFQEFQIRSTETLTLGELIAKIENYRGIKIAVKYGVSRQRKEVFNLWECAPNIPNFEPSIKLFTTQG
jgi:nucleoside-diphosphate-sugar epimerase